jgi:tyrosyl-DNA phosphodiesterase-1
VNKVKAVIEHHSLRFSNLFVFDNKSSQNLKFDKMKKISKKKKVRRRRRNRYLEMDEIKEVRNSKLCQNVKKKFFPKIKEDFTKNKFRFNIHGLALVRLLMHQHPTIKPFTLEKTRISYVSSSINVIDTRLLFDIAYSFIPKFPYESRHLSKDLSQKLKSMFNVIFPTEKYVENSTLGSKHANCIFLDYDRYHSRKFKKKVLAKFQGNEIIKNNDKVIPHLKVCIISNSKGKINDDTIIYIGSHNMTKAAWGRYNQTGSKLYVSNYEMGIIFPPKLNSTKKKKDIIEKLGFMYPAKKFEENDKPFMRRKKSRD